MKRITFILIAVAICSGLFAQSTVKGYVYQDNNKNGKRDGGEKGIANVAVSNGTEVVLTDSKGVYELPVALDNIIFVVKPAGYSFQMDGNNLPRFYYIYKPKGSPQTFYKGSAPTGQLPKSLDFPLNRTSETDNFKALIFGDPQPYDPAQVEFFKQAIVADALQNSDNVLFGLSLGDLVGDDLTLHAPYKQAIKQMGLPWYNVMGNHDMNYDVRQDSLSDEAFQAHFGPNNYSFNYGKAHFIILDDILYPDPRDGKGYWGGFRKDQLDFVKNDLKYVDSDKLIVVSLHIPLNDREDGEIAFRQADRRALYDLLKKYNRVLVLSAHTHIQYQAFSGKNEGLDRENPIHEYNVGATCGDWYSGILNEKGLPVTTMRDGTPQGYAFLTVKGNEYLLDYKVTGKPADYRMSIYHPQLVPFKTTSGSYSIYANVFMATSDDVVECRIDGGKWNKMNLVSQPDPDYTHYVQDWDYLNALVPGRRPSNPINCLHLWNAGLPVNLPVGSHTIEVRTTDMFGRTYTQSSTYRIAEDPAAKISVR
jgi:hypothetical protein